MALLPEPIPVYARSSFSEVHHRIVRKAREETGSTGKECRERVIQIWVEYIRSQDEICCVRPEPSNEPLEVPKKHRHLTGLPQALPFPVLTLYSHQPAFLSLITCSYITSKETDLCLLQRKALESWEIAKDDLMCALGVKDISHLVAGCNAIRTAIKIFNDLFLFGALRPVDLGWIREVEGHPAKILGIANKMSILLHPTLIYPDAIPAQSRLNTLLHEMIHAFLNQFSCRSCRYYGHGKEWQLITKRIEQVAPALLGFRAAVGRFDGLIDDLRRGMKLPSAQDILLYNFEQSVRNEESHRECGLNEQVEDITGTLAISTVKCSERQENIADRTTSNETCLEEEPVDESASVKQTCLQEKPVDESASVKQTCLQEEPVDESASVKQKRSIYHCVNLVRSSAVARSIFLSPAHDSLGTALITFLSSLITPNAFIMGSLGLFRISRRRNYGTL
ncbi:hypothetical protein BU16DRAFT_563224 [Lophium mytilinum]|uniref:SprT-like domain-containing protein n=1 Tax=Lophium mytilinum TaxID=390894 RepID=A0A6A6QQ73_9PEZI|nr:hypothetical protein BU16DRAFT_563224 [Lophium mytilinum]